VVLDSPQWIILKSDPATTWRLAVADVVTHHSLPASPMPAGRLQGLAPQALADLYSFLKNLPAR